MTGSDSGQGYEGTEGEGRRRGEVPGSEIEVSTGGRVGPKSKIETSDVEGEGRGVDGVVNYSWLGMSTVDPLSGRSKTTPTPPRVP